MATTIENYWNIYMRTTTKLSVNLMERGIRNQKKKRDRNFCMDCKLRKIVDCERSILTCTGCGLCEYYPVYVASYNHMIQPLRRKYAYKRSDNFKVILNRFFYSGKQFVPYNLWKRLGMKYTMKLIYCTITPYQ